jgi:acyl-coenzyme A synthetase/AMP-(fatty) acid ligase
MGYKLLSEAEMPESAGLDQDNCYIITTSGSTGNPKMILGSHKGLCHFIDWEITEFKLDPTIRGSFLAPVTFDVSLRDIFAPLCSGGMLCIPNEEIRIDYRKLFKWFQQNRISLTHMVPTVFRMLTAELYNSKTEGGQLKDLRWIFIAGEPLYGRDVNQWWGASDEGNKQLVNLYGPSETTLAKLYYRIERGVRKDDEIIPIGRPIPDTEVMILKDNKICPEGDEGEIHIKTPFASRGYLKDPEKNRRAFIKTTSGSCGETPVYRTGDYGILLPNGEVQFVGRRDGQIKLRGKKIDLGLIESHLRDHGAIRNCAVALKKDHYGYDRLVAYIVVHDNSIPDTETLKDRLRNRLPDYMVPAIFTALPELPLTHSGKIDRNALPEPSSERAVLKQKYVSPSTDMEKKLVRIWCEVLELEEVGIHDNFFDIGGSSILGMVVCTKIQEDFNVDMPILKVFENPTIHAIGKYLGGRDNHSEKLLKIRQRGGQRKNNFFRFKRNEYTVP